MVDLCEENSDPKNDAMFLDSLGTLLSTAQTFKQNYIVALSAIKTQIQQEKEKNDSNDDTNVDDVNDDGHDKLRTSINSNVRFYNFP